MSYTENLKAYRLYEPEKKTITKIIMGKSSQKIISTVYLLFEKNIIPELIDSDDEMHSWNVRMKVWEMSWTSML